VSIAPSITESLFAVGAGARIVGATEYCTFPPEARAIPRIGGLVTPSVERIVTLRPDLILVSMEGNQREDFDRLTSLGVPVVVTNPRTLEGIYRSLGMLGELTGQDREAASLVRSLREREAAARRRVGSRVPRVLLIVSFQPLMVAGAPTFLNELLEAARARNLGAEAPGTYPTLSREFVALRDPDMLLYMSDAAASPESVTSLYPEWRHLTAFRRGAVFRVDSDLLSRPGPRAVDALEYLVNILHGGAR
jgi:iron complex transport system substrate-binding protein